MAHGFHLVDEFPDQARVARRLLLLGALGSESGKKEGSNFVEALSELFELGTVQGWLVGLGLPVQDLVEAARTEQPLEGGTNGGTAFQYEGS